MKKADNKKESDDLRLEYTDIAHLYGAGTLSHAGLTLLTVPQVFMMTLKKYYQTAFLTGALRYPG